MMSLPDSPEETIDQVDRLVGTRNQGMESLVVEIITRFPADAIARAVHSKILNLDGPAGPLLLRLIEAVADHNLFVALADGLVEQPELPPEFLMEAMELLEGTGLIESRPALVELQRDLDALYDEDSTIEEFAAQIESEPEDMEIALEAIFLMTPEDRDEILAGLARLANGPVVIELLTRASDRLALES